MSGTNSIKTYYWDACVYLAWLMQEPAYAQHLGAISQIARENWEKKNVIITSTLTFIEVLASKIGPENEAKFRQSFRGGDHIAYDVDPAIALRARDFRERCLTHPSGKKLATPDAIHLATAAIYKAEVCMTFDGGGKDKKGLGMLELDGDPYVDGIKICRPFVEQIDLTEMLRASPESQTPG